MLPNPQTRTTSYPVCQGVSYLELTKRNDGGYLSNLRDCDINISIGRKMPKPPSVGPYMSINISVNRRHILRAFPHQRNIEFCH